MTKEKITGETPPNYEQQLLTATKELLKIDEPAFLRQTPFRYVHCIQ